MPPPAEPARHSGRGRVGAGDAGRLIRAAGAAAAVWAALAVLAPACGGGAGGPARCPGGLDRAPSAGTPRQAVVDRTVAGYLRALAAHRTGSGYEAAATTAARCSLDHLAGFLHRIPISRLQVTTAESRAPGRGGEVVVATLTARLQPGGTAVSLGQRALLVATVAGRPAVRADLTGTPEGAGTAQDGLAAIPGAAYAVGSSAVVVDDAGSPSQLATVRAVTDRVWPQLVAAFGPHGPPVVVIVPSWAVGERVADIPLDRWEAGVELNGLVLLIAPSWLCGGCDPALARGIVVHELTHVVTQRAVALAPVSLVEGVARLEEERYDAARGDPFPEAELVNAYARGWSDLESWEQLSSLWYQVPGGELDLRYLDAAAVLRAAEQDAGPGGFGKLAAALSAQAERANTAVLTQAQLDAAFRAATGRSFSQVAAQARREVLAGAAPGDFP
jgi:hypothetical protein